MPAARRARAVLVIMGLAVTAILLAGCSLNSGSGPHTRAWDRGYEAGKEARRHHHFRRHASGYDRDAFCIMRAYHDIQNMNSNLVQWTEGFDRGCGRRGLVACHTQFAQLIR
jgi:hypothetical protein